MVPRTLSLVVGVMGGLGALLVLSLALLINSDILSRLFFNHPLKGVAELVELAIVVIVFVQLPLTVATGGLVRASELHLRIGQRHPCLARAMTLVFEATGAVLLGLLAWALWPKFTEAWTDNLFKGQPGLFTAPIWPALLSVVIGSALAALCFATSFAMRLASPFGKERKP